MTLNEISSQFNFGPEFSIGDIKLDKILSKFEAPIFIYDKSTIENQYRKIRSELPNNVDIFYAMKANPNISIVKILTDMGAGVEIASAGELMICRKLKINPQNIIFAGPAKNDTDLKAAIEMGIYSINVESLNELKRINSIAQSKNIYVPIELRINPTFHIEGAAVNMGGGSQKFGIDVEEIGEIINIAKTFENIKLNGIHIYSATGILNQKAFIENMELCFKTAQDLNQQFPIKSIDIGGGLGIPYNSDQKELNIIGISKKINQLITKYKFIEENDTRIIIEPGRFLVGQSGIYVTKIIDRKKSRGKEYLLVDGGVQHLLRPALINQNHPTYNLSRTSKEVSKFDVGGNLCTSLDFLAKNVELPKKTKIGDIIGIFNSGAYGFTESMPYFLSHDIPTEVLVHNNEFSEIRKKVSVEKIIENQIIPKNL